MQLAAEGATTVSMYELNACAPEEVRAERLRMLKARRERLEGGEHPYLCAVTRQLTLEP